MKEWRNIGVQIFIINSYTSTNALVMNMIPGHANLRPQGQRDRCHLELIQHILFSINWKRQGFLSFFHRITERVKWEPVYTCYKGTRMYIRNNITMIQSSQKLPWAIWSQSVDHCLLGWRRRSCGSHASKVLNSAQPIQCIPHQSPHPC